MDATRIALRSVPFELTIPQRGAELPQGPLDACVCVRAHIRTHNSLHSSQCLKKLFKCLIFNFPEELTFKEACGKLYVSNKPPHNDSSR